MSDGELPEKPQFYGRRKTHKLRSNRQRLVDTLLPMLRVPLSGDGKPINLTDLGKGANQKVCLEIGFGAGEHLRHEAVANPDTMFIGCEPFINGVAALLAEIETNAIKNIWLWDDDARILLDRLPAQSVDQIFVLYPDPWPKTRHHRRRIIQTDMLSTLGRIAKDGASFLFATDHMGYASWTLQRFMRHRDWDWTAERPTDWRDPPSGWEPTRYEAKARKKGDIPVYLHFVRRPRTEAAN